LLRYIGNGLGARWTRDPNTIYFREKYLYRIPEYPRADHHITRTRKASRDLVIELWARAELTILCRGGWCGAPPPHFSSWQFAEEPKPTSSLSGISRALRIFFFDYGHCSSHSPPTPFLSLPVYLHFYALARAGSASTWRGMSGVQWSSHAPFSLRENLCANEIFTLRVSHCSLEGIHHM
jgi:hypothetical protein